MNRWLLAFVSKEMVLYLMSENRGKKVSFDGAPGRKQKCWAHLLDDARQLVEKKKPPPESLELHEGLLQIFKDAKEAEKGLERKEERSRVYTQFVDRLSPAEKNISSANWLEKR